MTLTAEEEALARACRFPLARKLRPAYSGETPAARAGGALLFHDHRPYQPGDDLRRVDWRAYGRTGDLVLKTFEEESAPRIELLLDASASMAVDPLKEEAARRWARFFVEVAMRRGCAVEVTRLGTGPAQSAATVFTAPWEYASDRDPLAALRVRAGRPRALRLLISDFLFSPGTLEEALAPAARGALAFFGLQVLAPDEIAPPWRGPVSLEDEDARGRVELIVGTGEVAEYQDNLAAHRRAVAEALTRRGGLFATVMAGAPLRAGVLEALVPAGMMILG